VKVYIKEKEGKRYFIPVPLSLIRAGLFFSSAGMKVARKHIDEETMKYIESIDFKLLSQQFKYLQRYKGLKLVEVKSKDGDEVTIII
jgi:hypothetical protein